MQTEFDGIVVGGGHNGLVCANYMARAGLSVLVLEATDLVGGGVGTKEGPVAGFYHNMHACNKRWNSEYQIWKDIELTKHGLRVVQPEVQFAQPMLDGSALILERNVAKTVESIRQLSPVDADTFERLHVEVRDVVFNILMVDRFAAPLPPDEMRQLLGLSDPGKRYLEFADSSVVDLIKANFKDDLVRAMLAFICCLRGHGPVIEQRGNGIILPLLLYAAQNGSLVEGGTERLAEAIVRSLYSAGGLVIKNRPAEKILVEGGRAVGVRSGAQTFRAGKFIASNLVPQQTLLDLAGAEHLNPSLVEKIKSYKPKVETLFTLHASHRVRPRYTAEEREPRLKEAFVFNVGYETLQSVLDDMQDCRNGIPPADPKLCLVSPTNFDSSLAPAGMHATAVWQFAPCELKDGGLEGWDKIDDAYGEKMLQAWAKYAPNVDGEDLLGTFVHSPHDTEIDVPSMVLGDRHHGEYSVDQMGYNRPTPELSHYATPIEGLYLCGASTYPGGAITGAPGHNAATRICRDLGVEPWWNPPDLRAILRGLKDGGTQQHARMGL